MNSQPLTLSQPAELVRQSTDVAGLCREIVLKTALEIQGRKFIRVEGYQSIATAHGCLASSRDVERVEGGYRAIGEVRRMSDGALLASAEGFVGEDEPTWFGGEVVSYGKTKTLPKRPDYAIRAMCQTRAISRACRSAFAHVVVLMDAGLSTTPAEEVPQGGFNEDHGPAEPKEEGRVTEDTVPGWYWQTQNREEGNIELAKHFGYAKATVRKMKEGWRVVAFGVSPVNGSEEDQSDPDESFPHLQRIHFGTNKGLMLKELTPRQLAWYTNEWMPGREAKGSASESDVELMNALKAVRARETSEKAPSSPENAPQGSGQPTDHEGHWSRRVVHIGTVKGTKGKSLADLSPEQRDAVRAAMEEKAKTGERHLKRDDRMLIAALAVEKAERKPAPVATDSDLARRELAKALEEAGIGAADFMACANGQGWFTQTLTSFSDAADGEWISLASDLETVIDAVRTFIELRDKKD